ncbi:lipase family protein [Sorangium sp. So ce406]|uniref:lipase family protein n=1 Tax=Sorangium sp. So ce406 TaxID=3133311 RepID=UPI003F5AFE7E
MDIECVRVITRAENPGMPVTGELIRGVKRIYSEDICGIGSWGAPLGEVSTDRMLALDPTQHDHHIANVLCTASAWAYSDVDTLARVMHCRGLMPRLEIVGIVNRNPALFVDTTAHVIQSEDRRVAILCFRGTGLQNVVNWLADVSVHPDPFLAMGRVHGGFLRGLLTIWPMLGLLLDRALQGQSICDATSSPAAAARERDEGTWRHRGGDEPGGECGDAAETPGTSFSQSTNDRWRGLEALYITGHSLGGALAVLAAALIQVDPELKPLRKKLRSIYTYGQPMVGDAGFRAYFRPKLDSRLFRHIYGSDIVPRLPPWTTGKFTHIGKEYASSDTGWMYRRRGVRPVRTALGSVAVGVVTMAQKQLPRVPFLRLIRTHVSWGDHSPLNYLRTSQMPAFGSELI